jgi:hypothetical protein
VRGVLATFGVAAALAGCGGDAREDYRKDAQRAADQFKASAEQAAAQLKETDGLREKLPGLRAFKVSVDELASDFEELEPPDDLQKLNDEAVTHMRALSEDLGRYEQAAEAGDEQAADALAPELQADQSLLQSTLDRLDREFSDR